MQTKSLTIHDLIPVLTCSGASNSVNFNPDTFEIYTSFSIGNSMPMRVWHNLDLYLGEIPNQTADTEELVSWLHSLTNTLAEIAADHTEEWDGSNHVGKLGKDGMRLLTDIQEMWGDQVECLPTYWEASEWFDPCQSEILDEILEFDSLDLWAEYAIKIASAEGAYLKADDVRSYGVDLLQKTIDRHDEEDEDEAEEAHLCREMLT